jgi:hypothetical protein
MGQPHWVYIATFADGSSKVGTAADQRQKSRLDEQGAVVATYVARTADGRIARNVEDAVSRECEVVQSKSRSAKLSALATPLPAQQLQERHDELLNSVMPLVDSLARTSTGVSGLRTQWVMPDEMKAIVTAPPRGGWPVYEHEVQAGEHGLYFEGCCGQTALVHAEESEDPVRYLIDLGKLKGLRITAGQFSSPGSAVQNALF